MLLGATRTFAAAVASSVGIPAAATAQPMNAAVSILHSIYNLFYIVTPPKHPALAFQQQPLRNHRLLHQEAISAIEINNHE